VYILGTMPRHADPTELDSYLHLDTITAHAAWRCMLSAVWKHLEAGEARMMQLVINSVHGVSKMGQRPAGRSREGSCSEKAFSAMKSSLEIWNAKCPECYVSLMDLKRAICEAAYLVVGLDR